VVSEPRRHCASSCLNQITVFAGAWACQVMLGPRDCSVGKSALRWYFLNTSERKSSRSDGPTADSSLAGRRREIPSSLPPAVERHLDNTTTETFIAELFDAPFFRTVVVNDTVRLHLHGRSRRCDPRGRSCVDRQQTNSS
jgi:hypothetical protein